MLKKIHLPVIKIAEEAEGSTTFEISPLYPGYGQTLAVALRRMLLSSITGSAITAVKIDGIDHEFAGLDYLKEDIVSLILNLKKAIVNTQSDTPVILSLSKKGVGPVTLADFESNSLVSFENEDLVIANLTDSAKTLKLQIRIEQGRGYLSSEATETSEVGWISLDANYSPVLRVEYTVENTRVGNMTNLDKVRLTIFYKQGYSATELLSEAAQVLIAHFEIISQLTDKELVETISTEDKVEDTVPVIENVVLEDLNLSSRTLNAVKQHGINDVNELIKLGMDDLKKVKGLGQKALDELSQIIEEYKQ